MESVETAPTVDSFTPLEEHQQQTPRTFFGGTPVLHLHCSDAKVLVSQKSLGEYSHLQSLLASHERAQPQESEEDIVISGVQIWVSSRNVILFSNSSNRGLSISYPTIGLHALGSSTSAALSTESAQVVILQLNLHDADTINSDDDLEILDITLLPLAITPPTGPGQGEPLAPSKALFEALSSCADLHPDPQTPGSEGPELSEPGEGGWITAENMDRFVDADDNFTGLGPGAGNIHEREDDDDESGVNGKGEEEGDDTKWQRTA